MSNTVVVDRFEGTAVLELADAVAVGTLGVVARASGLELDARVAHPFIEGVEAFHCVRQANGDVLARFTQRVEETRISLSMLDELAASAPNLSVEVTRAIARSGSGVGIVEGWRGSIVHRVELDDNAVLLRCRIVDPSFLNWPAVSVSLADTIVPDFPLVNKSFNLSYAGNDL